MLIYYRGLLAIEVGKGSVDKQSYAVERGKCLGIQHVEHAVEHFFLRTHLFCHTRKGGVENFADADSYMFDVRLCSFLCSFHDCILVSRISFPCIRRCFLGGWWGCTILHRNVVVEPRQQDALASCRVQNELAQYLVGLWHYQERRTG